MVSFEAGKADADGIDVDPPKRIVQQTTTTGSPTAKGKVNGASDGTSLPKGVTFPECEAKDQFGQKFMPVKFGQYGCYIYARSRHKDALVLYCYKFFQLYVQVALEDVLLPEKFIEEKLLPQEEAEKYEDIITQRFQQMIKECWKLRDAKAISPQYTCSMAAEKDTKQDFTRERVLSWEIWQPKEGYIQDQLLVEHTTIRLAKSRCKELEGCLGFYYRGKKDHPEDKEMKIYFGSSNNVRAGTFSYTSYFPKHEECNGKYCVGDRVEVKGRPYRYLGWNYPEVWTIGWVVEVRPEGNTDGSMNIRLDMWKQAWRWQDSDVRKVGLAKVGDEVEAKKDGAWLPATIQEAIAGKYKVKFIGGGTADVSEAEVKERCASVGGHEQPSAFLYRLSQIQYQKKNPRDPSIYYEDTDDEACRFTNVMNACAATELAKFEEYTKTKAAGKVGHSMLCAGVEGAQHAYDESILSFQKGMLLRHRNPILSCWYTTAAFGVILSQAVQVGCHLLMGMCTGPGAPAMIMGLTAVWGAAHAFEGQLLMENGAKTLDKWSGDRIGIRRRDVTEDTFVEKAKKDKNSVDLHKARAEYLSHEAQLSELLSHKKEGWLLDSEIGNAKSGVLQCLVTASPCLRPNFIPYCKTEKPPQCKDPDSAAHKEIKDVTSKLLEVFPQTNLGEKVRKAQNDLVGGAVAGLTAGALALAAFFISGGTLGVPIIIGCIAGGPLAGIATGAVAAATKEHKYFLDYFKLQFLQNYGRYLDPASFGGLKVGSLVEVEHQHQWFLCIFVGIDQEDESKFLLDCGGDRAANIQNYLTGDSRENEFEEDIMKAPFVKGLFEAKLLEVDQDWSWITVPKFNSHPSNEIYPRGFKRLLDRKDFQQNVDQKYVAALHNWKEAFQANLDKSRQG